ncbi:MAG: prepilin-type N-terminal cleavage/methylation domain-containing protein [Desulfuromonadaceae bacterium]|nr:prepilin-type N-terminal cleavage/methylation domain-containing protein [Desulfuromonadaceae bacterium]
MNGKIKKSANGFTLMEIIIVLGVLGIVAAIAVPAINNWLPNYRLKGVARELFSQMQKARSEAVKRNTCVIVEFENAAGGNRGGYKIFIDDGEDGGTASDGIHDDGERILIEREMPSGCSLYEASFGGGLITGYNARGLPFGNNTGSVKIKNEKSRYYQMSLSNSGYPKIKKSSDETNFN